ncbi:hypothetical protein AB0B66_18760 [Catellatospora sp. NPDC049111]|uniref:hypothetical protein n=1 Tax=Catellatospora sp. NPDC049111 TaxID=3155271 RepID=UPI0033D60913
MNDALWRFYVAAGRPSTRKVAETIQSWDEERRTGSANHETVRRALKDEAVGAWLTVEVIFLALCELADVDPDDSDDDDGWRDKYTHRENFHRYWHEAVDEAPMPHIPKTRGERAAERAAAEAQRARVNGYRSDDPWATAGSAGGSGGNFDDEPPF